MDPERKAKLGQRWSCSACDIHFYDLQKPEPRCPRCQADPRVSGEEETGSQAKRARKRPTARKKAASKKTTASKASAKKAQAKSS